MDDAALIAGCRAGDRDAWSRLVDRYGPMVLTAIRVRMGGRDAEDRFQEFWAHVMEKGLGGLDPARPPGPYLVAAALNLCRRRLADEARRRGIPPAPAPQVVPDPAEALADALAGLTPRERLILTLVEVEGLPHARVAEALGVAPGSVSVLAERARKRLRERLRE